ncbi:hypothetical protein DB346_02500 [Verrucomicrobia bacterium LW23]|nr:hypothetical protein DB346_04155 [Verrucomicrobia bacterium LW23]PTY04319.1 hypothetical protein DB346_02500 [Verrucomicrobia bacterium LW23]
MPPPPLPPPHLQPAPALPEGGALPPPSAPPLPGATPGYQKLQHVWYQHYTFWSVLGRMFDKLPPEADWTDRIHPGVLLEARRGLRSYALIWALTGLHVAIMAALAYDVAVPGVTAGDSKERVLVAFWTITSITLLVVLPGIALFSMDEDRRSGAMELLIFTAMGPTGVMIGKWIAKAIQAALIATTLMPYVVLHYFQSGSNPFIECFALLCVVWASLCYSALAVAVSTVRSLVRRFIGFACAAAACHIGVMTGMQFVYLGAFLLAIPIFILAKIFGFSSDQDFLFWLSGICIAVMTMLLAFTFFVVLPLQWAIQGIVDLRTYLQYAEPRAAETSLAAHAAHRTHDARVPARPPPLSPNP